MNHTFVIEWVGPFNNIDSLNNTPLNNCLTISKTSHYINKA